jgi:hypothetical protein
MREKMEFVSGTYLAFKISEESRAELLRLFTTSFSKIVCHHVTIEFNLTPEKLRSYSFNKDTKVEVVGYARGDNIEALAVEINGSNERRDGSFYHVTLSLQPPAKPVDSNKLKNKVGLVRPVRLTGEFTLLKK